MTEKTQPTDAELDALRQANHGELNFVTLRQFRVIARAALAKWGAPQPVNLNFTLETRAGADVLVGKDGGCRPATSAEVAMWKALSAVQQPVVREPLTDEAITAARARLEGKP